MIKFKKQILLSLFILLCLLIYKVTHAKNNDVSTEDLKISVNAAKVADDLINEVVELSGSVLPANEIRLSPKGSGNIIQILVDTGVHVKMGQVLAKIDYDDPYLAKQSAYADVIDARAYKKEAKAKLSVAAADIKVAMANLIKAKSDLKRYIILDKEGAISHLDFDRISTNFDVSKAEYEAAKANYDEAKAAYDGSQTSETLSNAQYKKAVSELNIAEKKIKDTVIRAPFDGYVVKRNIEPGTRVTPSDVAYILVKKNIFQLKCTVAETDSYKLYEGQRVAIYSSILSGFKLNGHIKKIEPYIDPQTRMQLVRIFLPENKSIRYGMYLNAQALSKPLKGIVVPENAVLFRDNKYIVFVIDNDYKVHSRDVLVGIRNNGKVQITKGLRRGELVVTDGSNFLNEGDSVNVYQQ